MVAAVQLNKVASSTAPLPFSYHYEIKEGLTPYANNTVYDFPPNTLSSVKFQDQVFNPVRIHLTTNLHKGAHDSEIIVEHEYMSRKLFLCFALKKTGKLKQVNNGDEMAFPLAQSPLDHLITRCNECLYYKTSGTMFHVFFCPMEGGMEVGDDFPKVLDNAKAKYKEIFEPNAFDILTNLFTRNDYRIKVVAAVDGGRFGWIKQQHNAKEGFTNVDADSYMECELLENEDGKVAMAEYALTPLTANSYERSLVTFVTALQLILVVLAGGIILPYIQCTIVKEPSSFLLYGGLVLHCSLFIVGIILLSVGLASKTRQKKKKRKVKMLGTNAEIEKRRMWALLGIYFILLYFANAVGMMIQFPYRENLYQEPDKVRDGNYHYAKILLEIVWPTFCTRSTDSFTGWLKKP